MHIFKNVVIYFREPTNGTVKLSETKTTKAKITAMGLAYEEAEMVGIRILRKGKQTPSLTAD